MIADLLKPAVRPLVRGSLHKAYEDDEVQVFQRASTGAGARSPYIMLYKNEVRPARYMTKIDVIYALNELTAEVANES